jgi:hypothetical protein
MSNEITEQSQKVRVEILIENPNHRIETFEEIFAKRKRLREEAQKAREDSMKRA